MTAQYQDYYKTLGVSRDASQEEIQKSFRKLARQYHPDMNKDAGAEDQFKRINEAYEVLKDPDNRKKYDALGANWKQGQRMPPGWGQAEGAGGAGGADFSDFFRNIFGGGFGGAGAGNPRGFNFRAGPGGGFEGFSDLGGGGFPGGGGFGGGRRQEQEVELPVTLREVFEGATKEFSLRVQEHDGRVQTRNHKVRIPKGATDGTSLRVPSQDGGDLLLKLKVTADPVFQLDGHDLTAKVKVEAWKAALGGQVEVPTLAGPVSMKVPAGVQTGQKLRLKGKGLPRREGEMGDLFALVEISVPKALSEQERALYEELAKLAGG